MKSSCEVSLMMGKNDACVNALKELLYRTETANYENLLKIVKESNIQAILKLRKSRWVKNDAEYAQFLIDEFDSGFSKCLIKGHTKRSYLSEKMICAPMRISKKFPGKSIGKQYFVPKSREPNGMPIAQDVFERYELKHNALRIKFLQTVIPAELKFLLQAKAPMPKDISKTLAPEKVEEDNNTPLLRLAMMPYQGPISVQAGNTAVPRVNDAPQHSIKAVPFVAPPMMDIYDAPQPKVWPLNVEQKLCPPSFGPPPFLLHANLNKPVASQDRKSKSILSTVQGSKFGSFRSDHNDIPDLLSGFDMHAASLSEQKTSYVSIQIPVDPKQTSSDTAVHANTSEHPLFVGPIGESPYITSKSFDDLHQCLTSNQIPYLDLNEGHSTQQKEQKMNTPPSVASSCIPIHVSTTCPSSLAPLANQTSMVSFRPQLSTLEHFIPAGQYKNVAFLALQKAGKDLATIVPPGEPIGALSNYNRIGVNAPFSNAAASASGALVEESNKRDHDDNGFSFHSLRNYNCTKRFKSTHAVSTTSEPSSDGGFDSDIIPSSNEYSSATSTAHSKQASNLSDSSETD